MCSTGYGVRRFDRHPARAHVEAASTEQNGLAPRPAARQGASRARNCAAKSVFSFDGSTAVFFLGRQKENGGGKPSIFIDTPGRSVGPPRSSAPTGATRGVLSRGTPYLGHGLRRPNSVPKFGASVKSSAPTGGCGKPPATAGAALSEAESAERAAGQIQVLPDDLFVQHGVPGSVAC